MLFENTCVLCVSSESESGSVLSDSLQPRGLHSPRNSPGQNIGVGCLSLSRGSSQPRDWTGFPHCRRILYQLSHKGSRGILKWVGYPFSSGSSQPRNQTRVSCIAGGFFTNYLPDCKQELCLTISKDKINTNVAFFKWMPKRFFMWYKMIILKPSSKVRTEDHKSVNFRVLGKLLRFPACVHPKSFQSCSSLCDPMDCRPPGSSVHGILQARIVEWVAMPSSRGSSPGRGGTHLS